MIQNSKIPYCLITDILSDEQADRLADIAPRYPDHVIVAMDHNTPCGTVAVAEKQKKLIEYARRFGTVFYYGQGIGYHLAIEDHLKEGDVLLSIGTHAATVGAAGALGITVPFEKLTEVISTGSFECPEKEKYIIRLCGKLFYHTAAKDIAFTILESRSEYEGKLLVLTGGEELGRADWLTLCNILSQSGAFSVIRQVTDEEPDIVIDLFKIERKALLPGGYDKIVPMTALDGIRVSQVFFGGCMGGSIETMRQVAKALEGKRVSRYVRVLVAPATSKVYEQMLDEGLVDPIMRSGALVMNQSCSACWAQSQGLCDDNEVFVTTGSINCANWVGRNNNGVYISSPELALKAALTGVLYEN